MPQPPYIQESDGTVRQGLTVSPTALRVLDVDDPQLTFIRVDHQLRFQLGGTEVVIETAFTLVVDGERHVLDPEERSSLGPVLGLYPGMVTGLTVGPDGTLRMDLDGGARLTVPPHPRYEAWQVAGPGTQLVVCAPGGMRLSRWT